MASLSHPEKVEALVVVKQAQDARNDDGCQSIQRHMLNEGHEVCHGNAHQHC